MNKRIAWGFIAVLAVAHYDFWFWSDRSVVFGFMPIGLFYQAMISLAAGIAWALVVKHAWPTWVEAWADATDDDTKHQPESKR